MLIYNNAGKVGDKAKIVELDENCVARRKYQVNRIVLTVWMIIEFRIVKISFVFISFSMQMSEDFSRSKK